MSDIHIERIHTLGLGRAREVARQWTDQAERDYGMACQYIEGGDSDVATFSRPGLEGSVAVTADSFKLQLSLGFLLAAFKGVIEEKLTRKLDEMLACSGGAAA